MQDTHISLAHGNGGRLMRELIEDIFARHLGNPDLDVQADAVTLAWGHKELVFSTDGFTVQPLEFPGGNIGSLAVHGTTNDLAVSGAIPRYLSLNAFIEEGTEVALLERIVISLAEAAKECGVVVAAGDTKILRRGEGGGIYLATTGIGEVTGTSQPALNRIKSGDAILVSGPVGDHGIAVMLAREQFGLRGELLSDSASVLPLTSLLTSYDTVHFMRDPTRGGIATVCHEIMHATGFGIRLEQETLPVRDQVQSVCDILGYDPLYLACEGRVVAFVSPESADVVLGLWRGVSEGAEAEIIGHVTEDFKAVVLMTSLGGERFLEELEDDPLPRIC